MFWGSYDAPKIQDAKCPTFRSLAWESHDKWPFWCNVMECYKIYCWEEDDTCFQIWVERVHHKSVSNHESKLVPTTHITPFVWFVQLIWPKDVHEQCNLILIFLELSHSFLVLLQGVKNHDLGFNYSIIVKYKSHHQDHVIEYSIGSFLNYFPKPV
jgi:hypothetical protein